jgi:biopolymer transport protein ExbD
MAKREPPPDMAIDMTPMIDMTFQLIAFFMILINFADTEQSEKVQLPSSTLAKPPDAPLETPITIQIGFDRKKDGTKTSAEKAIIAAQEFGSADALKPILKNEIFVLENKHKSASDANIIIRADGDARTGFVQNIIRVCQEVGFEKFTLRAKEKN